ncbi:glucose-6-phosphate dehydrogenase, partial [Bacillus sp. MBGLi97]
SFYNLNVNNTSHFSKLNKILNQKNRITINYFTIPPNTFSTICKNLNTTKLNTKPTHMIMKKPLNTSLETSQKINNSINKFFNEN